MRRRTFLASLGAAAVNLPMKSSWALTADRPFSDSLGLQLWTIRFQLEKNPQRALQAVADAGYDQVELMDVTESEKFAGISKDLGLKMTSAFINWNTIVNPTADDTPSMEQNIEAAKKLGLKYLVFGYIGKGYRESADQFKAIADASNRAGEMCQQAGIQLCYHNHSFEFLPLPGQQTGFDIFVERFDPKLTQFELDVFWLQIGGLDPAKTMQRLKGRVCQLHLKDLLEGTPVIYDEKAVPHETFKELGAGIVDLDSVLKVAQEIDVAQCHVEQDRSPDPLKSIGVSMNYMRR